MKNKTGLLIGGIIILLGLTGFVLYKAFFSQASPATSTNTQEMAVEPTPLPADTSLVISASWSKTADNTVSLTIKQLAAKYQSISYELTYDSQGLIKGVDSGSNPVDVKGKDSYAKDIFLGTCSRNVCTSDKGVTKVSLALIFTDLNGQKSQFSKDFDL